MFSMFSSLLPAGAAAAPVPVDTEADTNTPPPRPPRWYNMEVKAEVLDFEVYVNIYDVGHRKSTKNFNDFGRRFNTGVYHAGVELAGLEWAFAAACDGMSGVYRSLPRQDPHHTFRESIPVGRVRMSQIDLECLIIPLQRIWQGRTYDVVRHNCCHFAAEVLRQLGLDELPSWVTAMSLTGAAVEDGAQQIKRTLDAARDVWQGIDEQFQITMAMSEWGFCRQAQMAKKKNMIYKREDSVYNIDVRADEEEENSGSSSSTSSVEEVPMYSSPMRTPNNWVWDETGTAL